MNTQANQQSTLTTSIARALEACLISEYEQYCAAQSLPLASADELVHNDATTPQQREWLSAFIKDWDAYEALYVAETRGRELLHRRYSGLVETPARGPVVVSGVMHLSRAGREALADAGIHPGDTVLLTDVGTATGALLAEPTAADLPVVAPPIPPGKTIPTTRAPGFPKLVASDLEAMDECEFQSHLILEGSWGSRPVGAEDGTTKSTMVLYRNPKSVHPYMIEWDIPELETTESIGLTFDNDRNLVDYDGICGYPPIQAIELLERNGYHVGSDFRDEDEDEDEAGVDDDRSWGPAGPPPEEHDDTPSLQNCDDAGTGEGAYHGRI